MAKAQIFASRGFCSASTTHYTPMGEAFGNATGTEDHIEITWRTAGVFSKLSTRVYQNDLTTASTLRLRINNANATQVVSMTALTTGEFTDTTNTDSINATDEAALQCVGGSGSGFCVFVVSILFESNTASEIVKRLATRDMAAVSADSTTWYLPITGGGETTLVTTENNVKHRIHSAMSFRNLQIYSGFNTRTTTTTFRFRKNGGNGNMAISIPSSTTGILEDTTNTDTVVSGDDVNYSLTTGTGGNSFQCYMESCEAYTSNYAQKYPCIIANVNAASYSFNSTLHAALGGTVGGATSTTGRQVTIREDHIATGLTANFLTNSINGSSTFALNVGGTDTALSLSIPSSTSGRFSDTTNAVNIAASSGVMYRFVSTGSSGSATLGSAGLILELISTKIKKVSGVSHSSIKKLAGVSIGNLKKFAGVSNV